MQSKIRIFQITAYLFFILFIFSCKSSKFITQENSVFYTDSIFSKNLNETRKHNVYLPIGFDKLKQYPIIYATDGGCELTEKKQVLDSLI